MTAYRDALVLIAPGHLSIIEGQRVSRVWSGDGTGTVMTYLRAEKYKLTHKGVLLHLEMVCTFVNCYPWLWNKKNILV